MIDLLHLPTHLALVARRLNAVGPDASADTFLYTSYLAEAAIKTVACVLHGALRDAAPDDAYRMGYYLIQADGLGNWDTAIRQCTTHPMSAFIAREFQPLVSWATRKRNRSEDAWFREPKDAVEKILHELGDDEDYTKKTSSIRDLITALVRIRNKTKAHGAVGQDFFSMANRLYIIAVKGLIDSCPALQWNWLYLHFQDMAGEVRGMRLEGLAPAPVAISDTTSFAAKFSGIYVIPDSALRGYYCSELLRSNVECTSFMFPNGGVTPQGQAEFIDYAQGKVARETVTAFVTPPTPLPPSETEGAKLLDIQSNVFGNLPLVPKGYVQRKRLQQKLEERLLDRNHPIITLHGRGGVGKTTLALYVAHKLASAQMPHFDQIVWFSARDIDLRHTGPSRVRAAVLDLKAVSKAYGELFDRDTSVDAFAKVLQTSMVSSEKGTLFIFDNFETMTDVRGIHEFQD